MTPQTNDPLVQPAPTPPSVGAQANPDYTYRCEVCGDEVNVDYHALTTTKYGAIVRCSNHELPGKPPKETPRLHPSKIRAKRTDRQREFPPAPKRLNLDPIERMDYGVTVTIRNTDGDLDTLVGAGPTFTALADVCQRVDTLNLLDPASEWRVATVSTPATIHTDLQGHRDAENLSPETRLLTMIGRRDLDGPHPYASRSGRPPSPL